MMVHPAAGFGMWRAIQQTLDSARVSFNGVKNNLDPVLGSATRGGSFLGLNKTAWKLGMRIRTLAVYRDRLRAQYMAFKVGLAMMQT